MTADFIYSDFRRVYYPMETAILESIEMVGEYDNLNGRVEMIDVSHITRMLTDNDKFNEIIIEIISMYLHESSTIEEVIEELNSGIVESFITDKEFKRINNTLSSVKLEMVLGHMRQLIYKEGYDCFCIGWKKTWSNGSLGFIYV